MANRPQPPRWADRFLSWYCRPDLLEEIQGDTYELFQKRFQQYGPRKANLSFVWDVIRFFRLSNIRKPNPIFSTMLFQNDIKLAFRQMNKQRFFSIIKIGGLSVGIAACVLIALFIRDESSYDRHIPMSDRIFRVVGINGESKSIYTPAPFAKALLDDYPEVKTVGRFVDGELFGAGAKEFRRADQLVNYHEEGFVYADQSLLDLFQWPLIYGDPATALDEPNRLVISKSLADKHFPNENPVGQTVILDNREQFPYTIGGVIDDLPPNSHFPYKNLMTLSGLELWSGEQKNWSANNYHTYLQINDGTDKAQLEKQMLKILDKYVLKGLKEAGITIDPEDLKKFSFQLQPITEIHLHSKGIYDNLNHGDIRTVWLFGIIAFFHTVYCSH